jgi:hypothetical protein
MPLDLTATGYHRKVRDRHQNALLFVLRAGRRTGTLLRSLPAVARPTLKVMSLSDRQAICRFDRIDPAAYFCGRKGSGPLSEGATGPASDVYVLDF